MNGGNLIGRLSTGFIAPYFGVPSLMIISTAMCGILIFGMMGLSSVPSVVALGMIYGYFAGNCRSRHPSTSWVSIELNMYGQISRCCHPSSLSLQTISRSSGVSLMRLGIYS